MHIKVKARLRIEALLEQIGRPMVGDVPYPRQCSLCPRRAVKKATWFGVLFEPVAFSWGRLVRSSTPTDRTSAWLCEGHVGHVQGREEEARA